MKTIFWKRAAAIAGVVAVIACTGCANGDAGAQEQGPSSSEGSGKGGDTSAEGNGEKDLEKGKEKREAGEDSMFYDGADLQGNVVEFSDSGCKLMPDKVVKDGKGGMGQISAVPGKEKKEDLVTVTYAENVTFWVITMDIEGQTEISREETEKETLKKQSEILVYGECQDEKHWVAQKIALMRWE